MVEAREYLTGWLSVSPAGSGLANQRTEMMLGSMIVGWNGRVHFDLFYFLVQGWISVEIWLLIRGGFFKHREWTNRRWRNLLQQQYRVKFYQRMIAYHLCPKGHREECPQNENQIHICKTCGCTFKYQVPRSGVNRQVLRVE